jgi:hypothetical protein
MLYKLLCELEEKYIHQNKFPDSRNLILLDLIQKVKNVSNARIFHNNIIDVKGFISDECQLYKDSAYKINPYKDLFYIIKILFKNDKGMLFICCDDGEYSIQSNFNFPYIRSFRWDDITYFIYKIDKNTIYLDSDYWFINNKDEIKLNENSFHVKKGDSSYDVPFYEFDSSAHDGLLTLEDIEKLQISDDVQKLIRNNLYDMNGNIIY